MLRLESFRALSAAGTAVLLMVVTLGCEQLPGTPKQQGATIGGVGGAAAGAAVAGEHHRLLGALIGGAVGAGGGYLIGANADRITGKDTSGAQAAAKKAETNPATPEQARTAPTADLNGDGFVTMDEVAAMKQAGLSDQQMLEKLRATGQVFALTPQQQDYLRSHGVDQYVIDQMPQINRETRNRLLGQQTSPVVGTPPTQPASPPPAPQSQ